MRRVSPFIFLTVFAFATLLAPSRGGWIRAGMNTNAMVWGRSNGLLFAIPPSGFRAPEPRGLIRLGYPVLTNGGYDLINFIAIEPVVAGRKGFSELERSARDGKPGKQLKVFQEMNAKASTNEAMSGALETIAPGVEQLTVKIQVERFENGAEPWIEIQQRSDVPDEITLVSHAMPESAPMEYCILTATMGNRTRAREIWLRDGKATSRQLYPDYAENQFAPHTFFPLGRLPQLPNGDVLVAITNDEENPAAVQPFPNPNFWFYQGAKVTQYWKKTAPPGREENSRDLHAIVNARYVYWGSRQPIPGGVSFENFELRERFHDGDRVTFGITRRTARELLSGSNAHL